MIGISGLVYIFFDTLKLVMNLNMRVREKEETTSVGCDPHWTGVPWRLHRMQTGGEERERWRERRNEEEEQGERRSNAVMHSGSCGTET